jgi:hypothetical protein
VLVSGDGDYIKLVNYVIEKKLFEKILFPNTKYSTLYRKIDSKFKANLWHTTIKEKIEFKK